MLSQSPRLMPLSSADQIRTHFFLPLLAACLSEDKDSPSLVRILEDIAIVMEGKLQIGIIQQGFMRNFMKRYHIEGTPTLVLFAGGQEMDRLRGLVSKQEVEKFIITNLAPEGADHRSEAAQVIAYLGKNSPESRRLEETIRRAAKARTVTLCRTLRVLREELRLLLTMNKVVVVLATSTRVLLNLLSFQDRFDHLPLIVILPDAEKGTLTKAHRLKPRYVTLIGSDFSDVEFVLARLLERVDRQRNLAL